MMDLKEGDVVRLKNVAWLQDMAYRNVYLYDGKFGYLSQWLTDDVIKIAGGQAIVKEVIVQGRPGGDVRWVQIVGDNISDNMIISDLLIEQVIGNVANPENLFTEDRTDRPDDSPIHPNTAWGTQVSGNHYAKLPIQPMIFSMKNGLSPLQHNVIKYVVRYKDKNGKVDLEKAIHCLKLLIELEYPDEQ